MDLLPDFMEDPIYHRVAGYVITLFVHLITTYDVLSRLADNSDDPWIVDFATLQFRFFTIWTFALQLIYVSLGLVCDGLKVCGKWHAIIDYMNCARKCLFASLVWPSSLFVPLVFWPLYTMNPSYVFPPFIDKVLSPINNQVLHTYILPVALWELSHLPRSPPTNKDYQKHLLALGLYVVAYIYVLNDSYQERGTFVYPLLDMVKGTVYFWPICGAALFLVGLCYAAQWPLTGRVWSRIIVKKNL